MQKTLQATYEDGALHSLEPLLLQEHQPITIAFSDEIRIPLDHPLLISPEVWNTEIPHDEVSPI